MTNLDTQSDSSGALDTNQAANLFAAMLDPQPVEVAKEEPAAAEQPEEQATAEDAQANPDAEEQPQDDDPTVTVKVDGKDIEVKLSELKGSYQKDKAAQQRFEQAAELRKQSDEAAKRAEAEVQRTQSERNSYAQKLQGIQASLEAAIQQQNQTDWDALLRSDPIEYLNQKRLAEQRQAVYQRTLQERNQLAALDAQERDARLERHLANEGEALKDAIPEWKDAEKAKKGQEEVWDFLVNKMGFSPEDIQFKRDEQTGRILNPGISNHRLIVMARDAMLYRQMVAKADAAAKKVQTLPTKVERSGTGQNPGLDRRSSAFQSLSKSGRVEDAAAVFRGLI